MPKLKLINLKEPKEALEAEYSQSNETLREILTKNELYSKIGSIAIGNFLIRAKETPIEACLMLGDVFSYLPREQTASDSISICIKTLKDKSINLNVNKSNFVSELKEMIEKSENIAKEQQVLIFGAQILDDDRYLSSYGIENASIIYLSLFSVPKKIRYVDSFDADIPPKVQLSNQGEKWRCVEPGIALEGFCLNGKCEACFKMVIHNFGFSLCDLYSKEIACPLCKAPFEISNWAVNNCYVRVLAMEKIKNEAVKRFKGDWYYADNEYISFSRSKLIDLKYVSIYLEASLHDGDLISELECAICLDTIMEGQKTAMRCGHKYHKGCLDAWKSKKQACLVCKANVATTLSTLSLQTS